MQFLFKRRKKKIIEKGYCYVQSKWAEWMTKKTAKLSIRQQRLVFGFFIACAGCYSIYLISISFLETDSNRITINPIVKPVNTFHADNMKENKNSTVIKIELDKVIRFRAYIDSLAKSSTGKRVMDSIRAKRPGLLDSLAAIENYYQSHFKKYNYGK
jgi:hypothetical protein